MIEYLNRSKLLAATFVCCAMCVLAGCSEQQSATVSGTIVSNGEPLPDGMVRFSTEQFSCVGRISNGQYKLVYKGKESVPVEDYKVSVHPPKGEEGYDLEKDEPVFVPAKFDAALFPEKYRNKFTSGITFTPNAGENVFPIVLE